MTYRRRLLRLVLSVWRVNSRYFARRAHTLRHHPRAVHYVPRWN
jgi:hypothetical protein